MDFLAALPLLSLHSCWEERCTWRRLGSLRLRGGELAGFSARCAC